MKATLRSQKKGIKIAVDAPIPSNCQKGMISHCCFEGGRLVNVNGSFKTHVASHCYVH